MANFNRLKVIIEFLPIKDTWAREFHSTMATNSRWSGNQLRKEMDTMLYEAYATADEKLSPLVRQKMHEICEEPLLDGDYNKRV